METKNLNLEIEQLRADVNRFKDRLDKQQIVNKKMMRNAMSGHISFISRRYLIVMLMCVLMIPYSIWYFRYMLGLSLAFTVYSILIFIIAFVYTYLNGKDFIHNKLMGLNLLNMGLRVARAKKWDAEWLKIGIPMVTVWLLWLAYDLFQIGNREMGISFAIGGIIGGIIGGVVGFRTHMKIQKSYQSILDQIEELKQQD